jgi:CPA1 family monovalent cation:H+ antiporter
MVTARTRLELASFWRMIVYLLNGIIFIFIGLQLPRVVDGLKHKPWHTLIFESVAVSAVVVGVRLLWIFPSAYIPRFLVAKIRARDPYPDWRHLVVIGWAGMRGVDSLATALALPFITAAGVRFPGRDTIIFVSFVVILVTLVAQGLTLPLLIRLLKVKGDGKADCEERTARLAANKAALHYIEKLLDSGKEYSEQLSLLQTQYHERMAELESIESRDASEAIELDRLASPSRRFALGALQVERTTLIDFRNQHRINDETLRVLQRDIDLAEARLVEMEN